MYRAALQQVARAGAGAFHGVVVLGFAVEPQVHSGEAGESESQQ